MAAPGTSPILGPKGANIVDDAGKLTDAGREAFVRNVVLLLTVGNVDGKALPLAKALNVPMPPIAGPIMPAPSLLDPLAQEAIFWFGPDPTIALSLPYLLDKEGMWSKIFVDGFYAAIAKGLNLPGSYVPPLFDPTIYFPDFKIDLKLAPPWFSIPELTAKIPELLLKLGIPALEIPPSPKVPPQFNLPTVEIPFPPSIDFEIQFAFPKFFLDLILAIPKIILDLAIPKLPTLPNLFLGPFNILFDIFFKLLLDLKLILVSPKLLMATMLVILHNVCVMIACDAVGLVFGTGGIVKAIGAFGGL